MITTINKFKKAVHNIAASFSRQPLSADTLQELIAKAIGFESFESFKNYIERDFKVVSIIYFKDDKALEKFDFESTVVGNKFALEAFKKIVKKYQKLSDNDIERLFESGVFESVEQKVKVMVLETTSK